MSFEQWLKKNDDLIKYHIYEACREIGFDVDFSGYFSIDAFDFFSGGDSPQFKTIHHISLKAKNFREIIFYFQIASELTNPLKLSILNIEEYPLFIFSLAEIPQKEVRLNSLNVNTHDFNELKKLLSEFQKRRNTD